jgi:hypothetical protein
MAHDVTGMVGRGIPNKFCGENKWTNVSLKEYEKIKFNGVWLRQEYPVALPVPINETSHGKSKFWAHPSWRLSTNTPNVEQNYDRERELEVEDELPYCWRVMTNEDKSNSSTINTTCPNSIIVVTANTWCLKKKTRLGNGDTTRLGTDLNNYM